MAAAVLRVSMAARLSSRVCVRRPMSQATLGMRQATLGSVLALTAAVPRIALAVTPVTPVTPVMGDDGSHRRRATDRACRCSRSGWRGLSAMGSRSHLPKVRATGGVARRQSTFGRAPSAPPRRTCLSTGAIREARGQVAQESSRPRRTHGGGGAQNYNMVRRNGTGRAAATGFGRYTDGTRTFPRAGFGSRIRCNVGGGVRGGGSVTRSPRASDRRELMEGLRAALVAPRIAWGYHGA